MQPLTTDEKNKARVCFAVLVTALTMKRVNELVGITGDQPAIQQCTSMIDDLVNPMTKDRRDLVLYRVNRARIKLQKIAENTDAASALVSMIDTLTGPTFKSRVGTRFDFIRTTLGENVKLVKQTIPFSQPAADSFSKEFKKFLFRI